jgi:hypothetical protein
MPALTVSAAARLCGVDRRTLQRAIHAGRLPLDAQHCLSREALIAAGYLDAATPQEAPQTMPHLTPHVASQYTPHMTPQAMPRDTPHDAAAVPQVEPQEVRHAAAAPQGRPATPTRPHGLPPQTLQAIADERTRCEGLSLRDFAQRLHDKGIYSATAKDGTRGPANPGNVQRWLDQARRAGVL